jgi:hypothetical protein
MRIERDLAAPSDVENRSSEIKGTAGSKKIRKEGRNGMAKNGWIKRLSFFER